MKNYLLISMATLVLAPAAVFAQDAASTQAPATPAVSANAFEVTPSPASERLDYRLLYNSTFNQVDLDDAKAQHLSDRQIAVIYYIAREGGTEFREVLSLVNDGYTFANLADWYGVDISKRDRIDRAQDDIDAYEQARAATGIGNLPRPGRVESSIDSVKKPRRAM